MSTTFTTMPAPLELTPQQQFLNHARLYPIVQASRSAFYTLPFTKVLADSVRPTLQTIRMIEPLKVIMDQGDLMGVFTLQQLDRICPQLKTLEFHDLTDPVCIPINSSVQSVNKFIEVTNTSVQMSVIKPTNEVIYTFRNRFLSLVYDSNGRGIISSQADFVFSPINSNLEAGVARYFNDIKTVPKEGLSSEMSRTWRILLNALLQVHNEPVVPDAQADVGPVVV